MIKKVKRWRDGNYDDIEQRRAEILWRVERDPAYKQKIINEYATNPILFINDWVMTNNPNQTVDGNATMPLILFPKQEELIQFYTFCLQNRVEGMVIKSRDMGATWVTCAFSVWVWLFYSETSVLWITKKLDLLDRKGDINTVFGKLIFIIERLPDFLKPIGLNHKKHLNHKKLTNPMNWSTIIGEAGADAGRGFRGFILFRDESAWYPFYDSIDAASSETSKCRIDLSSVSPNAAFIKKWHSGTLFEKNHLLTKPKDKTVWVFTLGWYDHPEKDQKWFDDKRAKAEKEGSLHIFNQEIAMDPFGTSENALIDGKWIEAAVDAHEKWSKWEELNNDEAKWYGGVDISTTGSDKSAFVARCGNLVCQIEEWSKMDTYQSSIKIIDYCKDKHEIRVHYDANGVGAGIHAEWNRRREANLEGGEIDLEPFLGQNRPYNPDWVTQEQGVTNAEFFANLKSQGWWELRLRFRNTYRLINGEISIDEVDKNMLISLPSYLNNLDKLKQELRTPIIETGFNEKTKINKQPRGTASPNIADALMMCFHFPKPKLLGMVKDFFDPLGFLQQDTEQVNGWL